jgi:ectoine hydroxylase-related dioxygenase (phytanoyl-CoA dioxygenase family)
MDDLTALDRDGFVVLPRVLDSETVDGLERAVDAVYEAERRAGRLAPGGSLHLLGALEHAPDLVHLVDVPAILSIVGAALGWNIYVYHSHLDIHPTAGGEVPTWRWHQDGGRQNLELETEPRPRLSLKVAWFLSDLSRSDGGNLMLLAGSHRSNTLAKPRDPAWAPPGVEQVLAPHGSAVVFDRRLWHARSENRSELTRKVVFMAYTYRWVRPREPFHLNGRSGMLTPLRRQLLGAAGSENGHWLPADEDVPLRDWLAARGLLDLSRPWHS